MGKKRMRRYGAGLWLCLAVSAAIEIGAFAANEPTYRSAFAKDPADSTLYLYAAAVQTATCVVSSPVAVSAAEACALEITERFVCMASEFIDADALRGTEVYRQDFENAASLDTGYSVYAATGTTGEITMRANRVINGNASVFGGFDYRKENITWAKLFGVPENAFAIRSNTSYTVTFRYNVLTDPFLQLGEFYFIFNSKSGRQDRYLGFCSSGATAFRSGVTAYRLTPHDGYSFATVTLQTGDDDYTNCVFGIHLGGYVVIDDFAVYKNAVLPAPETTAACTAPQEEESVFVADFSDSRTYALRSGAYFTATAENGGVTVRNNGDDWAEGLRLCYDFAPNVLYKVTVAYGASARTDGYALIKGGGGRADR